MFSKCLIAGILASSALLGATSFAQDQAIVGIQSTTRYSLDGRIAAVDTNARTVTITSADGTRRMLNVSPMAANISSTRVGDNVAMGIEDTRSFVLSGSRTPTPAPGAAATTAAIETNQGVVGARASEFDRQLVGRERRPCRQHHHTGQSRWWRSAHL